MRGDSGRRWRTGKGPFGHWETFLSDASMLTLRESCAVVVRPVSTGSPCQSVRETPREAHASRLGHFARDIWVQCMAPSLGIVKTTIITPPYSILHIRTRETNTPSTLRSPHPTGKWSSIIRMRLLRSGGRAKPRAITNHVRCSPAD